MSAAVKKPINLIGTAAAPVTVIAGGTQFISADLSTEKTLKAGIAVRVAWSGGSLATAFTIQFFWSPDEMNFFEDKAAAITGDTGAAPATPYEYGPYTVPDYAKSARVKVTNKDVSRDIRVYCAAGTVAYTV